MRARDFGIYILAGVSTLHNNYVAAVAGSMEVDVFEAWTQQQGIVEGLQRIQNLLATLVDNVDNQRPLTYNVGVDANPRSIKVPYQATIRIFTWLHNKATASPTPARRPTSEDDFFGSREAEDEPLQDALKRDIRFANNLKSSWRDAVDALNNAFSYDISLRGDIWELRSRSDPHILSSVRVIDAATSLSFYVVLNQVDVTPLAVAKWLLDTRIGNLNGVEVVQYETTSRQNLGAAFLSISAGFRDMAELVRALERKSLQLLRGDDNFEARFHLEETLGLIIKIFKEYQQIFS
ncbi:hypothetical protein ABW19_dt0204109 [Dactylella cylindrospora]|nr:hypothetical protein ABW19_dt0204109 [Dactylella cylindrospora]